MVRKQLIALAAFATLAAAATAARADDITMANESFMSTKTRTEVRAEVLKARAEGVVFASEIDTSPTMARPQGSTVSREQVRAEISTNSRKAILEWYPA
jgi:Domain of unknown function (DUF4148)